MNAVNVGLYSGVAWTECRDDSGNHMKAPPSVATVQAAVAKYDSRLVRYSYFMDEPYGCMKYPGFPEKTKAYAKALQDGGAVPLLTYPPNDNAWIPGPYIWTMSVKDITDKLATELARVHDAGQSVWSYHVMANQDNSSPKWNIDYPPINERIHAGFINQSVQATGILCWATDYYSESKNSVIWDSMGNGDGMLVYNGARAGVAGVVCGTRMKGFREGIEDYEYVELLKKEGEGDWAMQKVRTVADGPATWTKNPDPLYAVRKELGERLSALNSPTLNWGDRTKERHPVVTQSSSTGIRISASRLDAVEIFDLRGNRLSLDRVSRSTDGNDVVVSGLPPGAFVVRVGPGERHETTVGLVQF